MKDTTIIFFLCICIVFLVCVVFYQQFTFRTGTQAKLREISDKLKKIIEADSDEQVMVFTDNKELIELAAQINELLEKHLKIKADYRHSQIASKKMLSNISHDIKTPMTVILGYLEIMQLSETISAEMLKKVFITMDTISDNTEIDTTSEFFGHTVSLPVYAAPISGILQNYGAELDDMSYTRALVDGCRRAGTLAFTGDGMHDEMFQGPMSVVKEHSPIGG